MPKLSHLCRTNFSHEISLTARALRREAEFFAAVFMACGSGLLLTFILSKCFNVSDPERVAITIEACYQNVGIATSMALGMYEGDEQI